jgi:hypothetical protein
MAGSIISSTVTNTVMLGGAAYPSPLTITTAGVVSPAYYGSTGVLAIVAGVSLVNQGHISGGYGYAARGSFVQGGVGVDLTSGGDRLSNTGTISGGASYDLGGPGVPVGSDTQPGFAGGNGVDLTAGTIHNSGTIDGGAGVYAGVYAFVGPGGPGGDGVSMDGGLVANAGTITGGVGAYGGPFAGGDGIVGTGSANVIHNTGTITGGGGGFGGEETDPAAGPGGLGVDLSSGGSLFNGGMITGGNGGSSDGVDAYAANGAAGVGIGDGTIDNRGSITGGIGGDAAYVSAYGGAGGVGVDLLAGGVLSNAGTVAGGEGGFGAYVGGGPGGAGVSVQAGATLDNRGLIEGGAGRTGDFGTGGNGGAGVVLDGGTLRNFGTVEGGDGGSGGTDGTAGVAVQFGTLASTLVLEPSAAFVGLVAADAAAADVLRLAGNGGTLTGLGTEFTGFSDVTVNAGATWTLAGTNTLDAGAGLRDLGALAVTGTLTGGAALIGTAGTLVVTGSLDAATLHFAPGGDALLDVGADGSVASTLTGFSGGDVIDVARAATTLSYLGGTLTLLDGSTAVATFAVAGHYTAASFHLDSEDGDSRVTTVPAGAASLPDFAPASLQTPVVAQHAIDPAFATLDVEPAALRMTLLDIVHRGF